MHRITITHGMHCALFTEQPLFCVLNKFLTVSSLHSIARSLGFYHLFEAFVLEMFFTIAIIGGLITVSHPSGKILGTSWIPKTTLVTILSKSKRKLGSPGRSQLKPLARTKSFLRLKENLCHRLDPKRLLIPLTTLTSLNRGEEGGVLEVLPSSLSSTSTSVSGPHLFNSSPSWRSFTALPLPLSPPLLSSPSFFFKVLYSAAAKVRSNS